MIERLSSLSREIMMDPAQIFKDLLLRTMSIALCVCVYDNTFAQEKLDNNYGQIIKKNIDKNHIYKIDQLGWKVCISPDGIGPYLVREKFFPTKKIRLLQSTASEGGWYLAIQHSREDEFVDIYFIEQNEISWTVSDDSSIDNVVKCPEIIKLYQIGMSWHLRIEK